MRLARLGGPMRGLRHFSRISLADAVAGDTFRREGRLGTVDSVQGNVKKGRSSKQAALVTRDLLSGARKEVRIKSAEMVELVELTVAEGTVQTVDVDQGTVRVLLGDTGEEIDAPVTEDSRAVLYFTPGAKCLVRLVDDEPLGIIVPKHAVVKVQEVPPRAERATDTKQMAVLENGRRVKVPGHVEPGQWIVVRPADESFVRVANDADVENLDDEEE